MQTNNKRIVITGLGVIAPNAIGKEEYFKALSQGKDGINRITLFDSGVFRVKTAAEIKGFNPAIFLGSKGLRTLDRSTLLADCAASLGISDAGICLNEENSQDTGVVLGTTLGSISSIMDFDKESLCEGAQYVNPALFSNTVINSPASQVSLRFKIKGLNATIATGWTASLEALRYAFDFLRQGRLKVVLAGGVEEMCLQLFAGFYKSGCLAGLKESEVELSCPFDKRRNGIILGEGSAMLVLEDYDAALSRQAQIYAEVKGFGRGFGEGGLKKSMGGALKSSRLLPEDIDCIFAAANSTEELDRLEACSIKETFPQRPPVSAIKSMLGEGYSSAGALQAAAAVAALKKGFIAPTINYRDSDASCDLNIVANEALAAEPKNILINACYPGKASSSLVISTFKG